MSPSKITLRGGAFLVAAAALLMIGAGPASAEMATGQTSPPPIDLTSQQEASIRAELQRFGVDADGQTALIDKLKAGDEWDSTTDAAPTSVTKEVIDGVDYTISWYEDGSFLAGGLEVPTTQSSLARGIQGCSSSGTSAGVAYRTNCLIIVTNGETSGQFRASFSWWSTGTTIYDVKSGWVNTDIGVAGATSFSSSTAPGTTKWTQLNWTTTVDGWLNLNRYVRLTVTTGGPSASANY